MVIAKSEWFKRVDGGFWNYKTPMKGSIYLLCTCLVLIIGILSPFMYVGWICSGLFLFLFFDGMYATVKAMDERDKEHYSIAMRNMAWGMIITLIVLSMISSEFVFLKNVSWLIVITAGVGGLINFLTRYKLDMDS